MYTYLYKGSQGPMYYLAFVAFNFSIINGRGGSILVKKISIKTNMQMEKVVDTKCMWLGDFVYIHWG